jgi:hypothetical protein
VLHQNHIRKGQMAEKKRLLMPKKKMLTPGYQPTPRQFRPKELKFKHQKYLEALAKRATALKVAIEGYVDRSGRALSQNMTRAYRITQNLEDLFVREIILKATQGVVTNKTEIELTHLEESRIEDMLDKDVKDEEIA